MDLQIDVELREGLLLVTARGDFRLEAAMRLLKQVLDTANEKRVRKILVTTIAVNGVLSTLDRYQLGVRLAECISEHRMNLKIAFLGKPPTTDGFAVRVAQNRGIVTEVFYNQQDALNWLAKWPS